MRILFIGNSHTYYNDMPEIFARICRRNGIDTEITMITQGGKGWDFHVKEPEVQFNIRYGGYDAVVLQHTAHPMGDLKIMEENGGQLINWIENAGARPVLYMTWAAKRDGKDGQPVMSSAYRKLAQKYDCELAPVGEAWWRFHMLSPDVEQYAEDGEHASEIGSKIAAYTIAAVILKRDAKALSSKEQTENLICEAVSDAINAEKERLF